MTILHTTSNSTEFKILAKLLDQELYKRYPDVQGDYDQYNEYAAPIDVLVILIDGNPAACGAIKALNLNNWVEIKRIFVHPDYRGQGLSKTIITKLEEWASQKGFDSTVLETGVRMPEALALYKKMGYQVVENFGPYVGLPHSICMQKRLV
ncbi:MAG: GNAT family N-acetyltransferase [Aureispira sp.]|nr:GNAT family N-acetyltransferase [Aureispira sp.]